MTKESQRDFADDLRLIAGRLEICEQVRRYDTAEEKQAWTLAHSFLDLAESFRTFLNEQLPRLKDESLSAEQVDALLLEIGEEFRHIPTIFGTQNSTRICATKKGKPGNALAI